MNEAIVLDRARQQPDGQFGRRARAEGPQSKPVLQFRSVAPTVLLRAQIIVEGFRLNLDLLGNKRDKSSRRSFTDAQGTPGIAEVAKHQRVAESAVIAPAPPDQGDIRLGQCVVAQQLTLIRKRIKQRGNLGLGQLLSAHCLCSPAF